MSVHVRAWIELGPEKQAQLVDLWQAYAVMHEEAEAARNQYLAALEGFVHITANDIEDELTDGDWALEDVLWEQHPANLIDELRPDKAGGA